MSRNWQFIFLLPATRFPAANIRTRVACIIRVVIRASIRDALISALGNSLTISRWYSSLRDRKIALIAHIRCGTSTWRRSDLQTIDKLRATTRRCCRFRARPIISIIQTRRIDIMSCTFVAFLCARASRWMRRKRTAKLQEGGREVPFPFRLNFARPRISHFDSFDYRSAYGRLVSAPFQHTSGGIGVFRQIHAMVGRG